MQTMVRHEAELESDPLWHVKPVQFVVQECRQTTVKLPRVADYSGGGVEQPLDKADWLDPQICLNWQLEHCVQNCHLLLQWLSCCTGCC